MQNKTITNQDQLRVKIKKAMEDLASIVGKTLGPGGLPILIERQGIDAAHKPLKPLVTKDGVTVARNIKVKDRVLNTIISSVIEVAEKTNIEAGDGPQPLTSKVLTPTGWVKMGDVKVGMKICGTNGSVQKVLGVFPKGSREVYELGFENRGKARCCKDHLWTVTTSNGKTKTAPVKTLIKDYVKELKDGSKSYKYYVPETYVRFHPEHKGKSMEGESSSKKVRTQILKNAISQFGFYDTYRQGLFEVRTESLAFSNYLVELARSLGYPVSKSYLILNGERIYRVKELERNPYGIKLKSIKPTGKFEQMACIKVSNPDHLYITDNYIPTHNTTTSIVLANALYQEGLKLMAVGERPEHIYEEVQKATEEIIAMLEKDAIETADVETIKNIATISANGDSEIGEVVSQAFEQVGEEGVITLEEGYDTHTRLEIESGFQIDRGMLRPEVFANTPSTGECILNNCAIIVYDGEIDDVNHLTPVIKLVTDGYQSPNAFMIIARDVKGAALNTIVTNAMSGNIANFNIIKGPHVGTVRTQMLQDIAIATGATMIIPDPNGLSTTLAKITEDQVGFAKKVVSTKYRTLIYEGGGEEEKILNRIDELKSLKTRAESPYDAQILDNRAAALSGGIAIVKVGGKTELEMKEKKDRIEDALNATRAAIQEGIIPGGGSVLFHYSNDLNANTLGRRILKEVLKAPMSQMLKNIGKNPELIMGDVVRNLESGPDVWKSNLQIGYDGRNKKVCNLIENNIIDPVKVTKIALRNAVSIANLLLTCGGSITIDESLGSSGQNQEGFDQPQMPEM